MKDLLKGSALIFSFKIIGALSLFGVHLIIARHYGAQTLGVFNLILALLSFGAIFSKLGLDMYVVRVLPQIEEDAVEVAGFLQRIFKLLLVSSTVSTMVILLFSSLMNKYIFKSFDASIHLVILAPIIIPFTFLSVVPEIFRGFQDIKIYSFFRNASQNLLLMAFLLVTIFVFNLSIDPVYLLYGVLIILSIVITVKLYSFLKNRNIVILSRKNYIKPIVKYSYPMLFTSSMMFVMGNIDGFMISYYLDESQVGIYAACLKISLMITFILTSVNGYILPKVSKAYQEGEIGALVKIYKDSIRLIVLATFPIICVVLFYPSFFLGLFGNEFEEYIGVLYIIIFINIVSVFIGPVIYILNMIDQQHYVKNIMFIGLVVNIGANIVLIPLYGISGAAISLLLSTLIWKYLGFMKLKEQLKIIEIRHDK